MAFTVVLDTCVLYPANLRDTLLRFAEYGLYRAHWSEDILDELRRNLIEDGIAPEPVSHLLPEMRKAFPHASVAGYRSPITAMTCDEKDRPPCLVPGKGQDLPTQRGEQVQTPLLS